MARAERGIEDRVEDADRRSRGAGGFAVGMIVGAVLGAGLALMFAPERGDTTRRRLRRRLERMRDDAAEGVGRAGEMTRREVLRRRRDPS